MMHTDAPISSAPAEAAPDVSVIIISYNTRDLTLECLRSLFAETTRYTFEVLVLDNCSIDNSAEAIEAEFGTRVHLIRSDTNLGFAGANNEAAKLAKADLLLLLNPDTIILDGAVDTLIEFAERRPESKIWGGRTVFEDGRLNPGSCWGRISLWSLLCQALGLSAAFKHCTLLNPEGIGGWKRDNERHVDIVSGCFLLINRSLWDRLGGFDPAFFMYGEDADLCLRAERFGANPRICPEARIVHLGGQSERVRADKIIRLYRARMQLGKRYLPRWQHIPARMLQRINVLRRWILWRMLKALGQGTSDRSPEVFAEVWRRRNEWLMRNSQ